MARQIVCARRNRSDARRLNRERVVSDTTWDVIVAGGGAAGLAAAMHAAALGWDTLVVTRGAGGGGARRLALVESVPGMPVGLSGPEYIERMLTRASAYGVTLLRDRTLTGLIPGAAVHALQCEDGTLLTARAVIIATGAELPLPTIPGAAELAGAGVYAVPPGGPEALAGRHVVVAGDAADVTPVADALRACCGSVTTVVQPECEVTCVCGVGGPESVVTRDHRTGHTRAQVADAVLLPCPAVPRDAWLGAPLAETVAHAGIGAAGGVCHRVPISVSQAIAEGIRAARAAHEHLIAARRAR
jgi:hypothetical protein